MLKDIPSVISKPGSSQKKCFVLPTRTFRVANGGPNSVTGCDIFTTSERRKCCVGISSCNIIYESNHVVTVLERRVLCNEHLRRYGHRNREFLTDSSVRGDILRGNKRCQEHKWKSTRQLHDLEIDLIIFDSDEERKVDVRGSLRWETSPYMTSSWVLVQFRS